jgi:hypothetical protein
MNNMAEEFKKLFPNEYKEYCFNWTKKDKENWEAVQKYIQGIEDAHKNAGKGHLKFGKPPIFIKTKIETVV